METKRSGWRLAAVYTIALRAAYGLYAVLLRAHLAADPKLVRSNAFVDHLMRQDNSPAYLLLGVWERFDTLWYLHIAQFGYDRQAAVVFYPLYPLLIRAASVLIHPPLAAALLVSTAATFFFIWGLVELIEFDLPNNTAVITVVLIAVWPGSFILFAGYADSLVMALTVWSICFARRGRWWLAVLTGLASGFAKAVGCLVAVALGYIAWRQERRRLWAAAAPLAAPAIFSLWIRAAGYGSSAAAYAAHWRTRVAWPWVTLARAVRGFFASPPDLLLRLNLTFFVLACGLVLYRRLRMEYRLYALATLAMFLTKSTDPLLQSTMRYILAVFPAFIALAVLLEKRPAGLVLLSSFFCLVNGVLLWGFFRWSLLV